MSKIGRSYIGAYVRIGRTPRHGPTFRIRRYDSNRQTFAMVNVFTNDECSYEASELVAAIEEGIAHIVGKVRKDS